MKKSRKRPASAGAIDETSYLLSSPANAKRLRDALAQINAGKGIAVDPAIFNGTSNAG